MNTIDWLRQSDPAIAWQAMRDLTDASPAAITAERARVPHEGLGAEILAAQKPDGTWRRADAPAWATTLFTLILLRATGVDRAEPAIESAMTRLEAGVRWNDQDDGWELRPPETGGNTFFEGEEEPCINGGTLAVGACFGRPVESLARRLLSEQLEDGGWNCEAPKSMRASFHTTICVLEGLLEYERAIGPAHPIATAIATARRRGEKYLLERGLFRRRSTGDVANPAFLEFAFPPRYHYDILRVLDYFRATGDPPDARIADALRVVASKRQLEISDTSVADALDWTTDGRWLLDRAYDEVLACSVGESAGEPSRWNTLRALRVLRWAGGQSAR